MVGSSLSPTLSIERLIIAQNFSFQPDHPLIDNPSTVVHAAELGFTQRWRAFRGIFGQTWQRWFYDFNVWSQRKEGKKDG